MFAFLARLVDKGYVKAWFSWVEWVTLTAAIWVVDKGYVKAWFSWVEWVTLTAAIWVGAKAWD
uniref:hypothetical protein n=1 Tax=Vibrio parahaemolyticus TaxID=670 RepID=UPI003892AE93